MPNKATETKLEKNLNVEQLQETENALLAIDTELQRQYASFTIDAFDNFTAEDYLQFKSLIRGIWLASSHIKTILEEYEKRYF